MSYPTGTERQVFHRGQPKQEEEEIKLNERDHRTLVLWAAECAEHVLPCFEEKYPEDYRPRNAVEAGRAWARGEIEMSEARAAAFAAHGAAREADQAAARASARAAGHAAATAHVAGHAAAAANYAVKAAEVSTDTAEERDRQYRRLPKHLWPVAFPGRGDN